MKHKRGQAKKKSTGQKMSDNFDTFYRDSQRNNTRGGRGRGGGGRSDKRREETVLPNLIDENINKPEKKGFRAIPIIPTEKEILAPQPENIPVNKIDGPYDSIDEYLKTHYELLREDCLRPLREGIRLLRDQAEENPNLRIYDKVNLVGVSFASIGVVHRISFITKHTERIIWRTSKRLIPGTLVIFSNDNFDTMKFGTVFNRPLNLLEKSYDLQIDVLFQQEDTEFEWPEGYIMVEATSSYFEAYRHVLNVIQELDPDTLPFKEHIIELNKEIKIPEYLEIRQPFYDFDTENSCNNMFDVKGEWPTAEKIYPELHTSQYDALKRMLTCRLALVQGPPGTGKTYVGLKAVNILLKNLPGPIVIACQTNHALDQFLEGILKFENSIIRLGSRSKSDKIRPYTLYKIRQEMKSSDTRPLRNNDINRLFRDKEKIMREMEELCEDIRNPFLDLDSIEELTDEQISSLKQDDWFMSSSSSDNNDSRNHIQEWLESSISNTTSRQNDIDYQVSQLILHDSGNQTDDEDEIDEEDIEDAEAEYHGTDDNQFMGELNFVKLRGEKCIRSDTYVSDETIDEYRTFEDLWEVPSEVRVAMHERWRRKKLEETCNELKKLCKKYSTLCDQIKVQRIREDLFVLKNTRVVGMTTTAAAKYHKLLMNLKPKIMIIEEAAETLEAHIVTALTPMTEHLILIGDHQQLRPNISVHELAKNNDLNVSLFERLIKFLPFSLLTEQRRMRPEIRRLLTPIYNDVLTDHECVFDYPDVPGFYDNLFFFDHQETEQNEPETMSKINDFEARMCAKLAYYLVKGGKDADRITILSMYSGQRKQICRYLKEDTRQTPELKQIRVSSVDGFQGEENDIIILSLVRSRDTRKGIGFLGISNRVCVALSRAKHGLYIFGNASQLEAQSGLWKDVLEILVKMKCCGQSIDIYCQRHSKKENGPDGMVMTEVSWYGDIPLEGGCSRPCKDIMECGHTCPSICHIKPHDPSSCRENCKRELPCGHKCKKRCNEPCEKYRCEETIILVPPCKHSTGVPCSDTDNYRCMEKCSKKLQCGHQCRDVCSSPWCTVQCRAQVKITFSGCGHTELCLCYQAGEKSCPRCII